MIEVERASAADFVRSRFMKPACYLGTNGPKMTDIVEHFNSQYVISFHERKKDRRVHRQSQQLKVCYPYLIRHKGPNVELKKGHSD